jgi:tripartite-type tricarboxylate transporter receptor subunit TctC
MMSRGKIASAVRAASITRGMGRTDAAVTLLAAMIGLSFSAESIAVRAAFPEKPVRLIVPFAEGGTPGLVSRRPARGEGVQGAGFYPVAVAEVKSYPEKPVRLIVPFAPGAAQDLTGRLIAQKLSEAWAQQVIVDNRAGAGSNIGAEIAAHAVPDGYTLLLANEALAINATLYFRLGFDPRSDFTPISLVVVNPRLFVANPNVPAQSMKDLIALARARPGEIRYGSSGIGTGPHLAGALLASLAKVELTHVPYKGAAPALVDAMAGQIQIVASVLMSALPHVQSGKLKALAVTSLKRSAAMPSVPTVAENALPGYEATAWSMLLAPARTPRSIVARIQADTARFLDAPDVRAKLGREGAEPVGSSSEQSADHLRVEINRWANVLREAGVKAE